MVFRIFNIQYTVDHFSLGHYFEINNYYNFNTKYIEKAHENSDFSLNKNLINTRNFLCHILNVMCFAF